MVNNMQVLVHKWRSNYAYNCGETNFSMNHIISARPVYSVGGVIL